MKSILEIEYKKLSLNNGLELVLFQRTNLPIVAVNIWYRVGSADEVPGKTGFAHLFEHMMFQGSQNVPKGMHFRYIEEAGGRLNGSTGLDRTNYYESLPKTDLELALWLESDRMGCFIESLTEEKLQNQKEVVLNERRQNYEMRPYGLAWEKLFRALYGGNYPYGHPTIGLPEDIQKFSLPEASEFFSKYYVPNNASLVIGGDFEEEETISLVEKYFGDIPGGTKIDKEIQAPLRLSSTTQIEYQDNVKLPRLYLAWQTVMQYHQDDASLDVLADLLSGSKNSRLYRCLVFEKELAQEVSCFQYSAQLSGNFMIVATAKNGTSLEKLKSEIFLILEEVLKNSVTEKEVRRSINSIRSSYVYSLQNIDNVVNQINSYNCFLNEPNSFGSDLARYDMVSPDTIKAQCRKYLNSSYVELRVIPKNGGGNES